MSYILDALRKADRERDRERSRVPSLATIHTVTVRPRWRRLPWLVTGLVLAGMGVTGWLVIRAPGARPVSPEPAVRVEVPRPPVPALPPEPADSSAREFLSPPPSPRALAPQAGDTPLAALPAPPPAASRRLIESRRPQAAPPIPPVPTVSRPPQAAPPPAPAAPIPAPDAVAAPLPTAAPAPQVAPPLPAPQPSAQDAMAKLTLTVLVHSAEKADRLVYINGRRYGEGDKVDGLYLVQAIQPDGVLLTYQGEEHFLRAVLGSSR